MEMMRKTTLFLLCLIGILPATAADDGVWPTLTGLVRQVGTFVDSMAVKGLDRRYIEAPKKPWQVILRGNINQSDLKLSSTLPHAEEFFDEFMQGEMKWEPRVKTDPATYAGFWAGYRGYGFGYSWNVGGDKGRILTFGATGGSYGVNLRIHWFDNDAPEINIAGNALTDYADDGTYLYSPFTFSEELGIGSPIKTRALFLDGYYLLNGKKCSYAAAYDQSVIQKRSAGSLMVGAMYFYSTTKYDADSNADLILMMNDIGCFRSWQASAGAGYIYNWVPVKGLLISGMAIPMFTFYNHYKEWRYDSNLKDRVMKEGINALFDMEEEDYIIRPAVQNAEVSGTPNVKINFDARLSVTYEWKQRYFINAFGQFSNFKYDLDNLSGRLNDWYVNVSLGIRL